MPSSKTSPNNTLAVGTASNSQRASPSPPSIQNITAELARWSPRNSNKLAIAIITNDTATPHNNRRSLSRRPWRLAIISTTSMLSNAPMKAAIGKVSRPTISPTCNTTITAPNVAPDVTPSKCGSASGLRVTACSTAPIKASPAPTSAPSSMRGTRISQTICSCPGLQSGTPKSNSLCNRMRHTTSSGTRAGPKPRDTTHDTSNRVPRTISNRA
ncbi:hypothetical protein D3C73_868110 [compost metagenome]